MATEHTERTARRHQHKRILLLLLWLFSCLTVASMAVIGLRSLPADHGNSRSALSASRDFDKRLTHRAEMHLALESSNNELSVAGDKTFALQSADASGEQAQATRPESDFIKLPPAEQDEESFQSQRALPLQARNQTNAAKRQAAPVQRETARSSSEVAPLHTRFYLSRSQTVTETDDATNDNTGTAEASETQNESDSETAGTATETVNESLNATNSAPDSADSTDSNQENPADNTKDQDLLSDNTTSDTDSDTTASDTTSENKGSLITLPLLPDDNSDTPATSQSETSAEQTLDWLNLVNNDLITVAPGDTLVVSGQLSGSGSFSGDVLLDNGVLNPGNSPGLMTFDNLILNNSQIVVQFAGSAERGVDYDAIDVNGDLSIWGTLAISIELLDNLSLLALVDQQFEILRVGGNLLDEQAQAIEDVSDIQIDLDEGWGFNWFEQVSGWSLLIYLQSSVVTTEAQVAAPQSLIVWCLAVALLIVIRRKKRVAHNKSQHLDLAIHQPV